MGEYDHEAGKFRSLTNAFVLELDEAQFLGKFHDWSPFRWGAMRRTLEWTKTENEAETRKMVDLEYEGGHIEFYQKCEFEENFKSYQNIFLKEFKTTEDVDLIER